MLGIGFVFFIVILISVWQVMKTDESIEAEESSAQVATPLSTDGRVSVPLAVDVRDTDKIQDQITQLKDERSELSKRLAEQESLIKEQLTTTLPLPGVTETQAVTDANEAGKDASSNESSVIAVLNQQEEAVTNSPDIAAVADKPEVKEVLPAVAEVAVAVQPKEEEKVVEKPAPVKPAIVEEKKPTVQAKESGWLKEKQLLAWPAKGYTLQLLGARSADSIDQFMRSVKEPEKIYYFQTVFKGAPWHVLVYGQYSNRDAAVRAVSALPEELRKMKPWPRSIKGVQADIQKK
jgi:DamX protein